MKKKEINQKIAEILSELSNPNVEFIESVLEEQNSKITSLENQLSWFKEQFKLYQQREFGRSTEKSNAVQADLFNEEEEGTLNSESPEEEKETITYSRRKTKQCGRKLDTSKLPRERRLHDLSEIEKTCLCGCALSKIGEDISEQVDYIPEQYKIIEHVRPKYVCRQCEIIKSADKPESPIPKCMATARLITDIVIKKYSHHLPLYRQSKIFSEKGMDIPDNTLGNWVMGAAEVLQPLRLALSQELLRVKVLQVDETPVTVLKPHKKGYLWAYQSCDPNKRFIFFEFSLSRAAENVNRHLKTYQGLLQTDGYSGYSDLRKQDGVVNFGCWDHARRKFVDVVKVNGQNKSGKAGEMLILMSKLYDIEREAKSKTFGERKSLRQEKSKPILELIYSRLKKINAPPQGALGKAVQYALNQWKYLINYVDYGEVEISNCWVENQICRQ